MADYIERQAAVEAIKNDACELVYYSKADAISCLEAEPAANVRKDVQGEWLEPDYPICCAIKCSVCGETEYLDDPDQYEHWRFCPLCGARMEGGGEP